MSLLGKQGFRQVSELCYHKAHYAAEKISEIPGFSVCMDRPFFHEFVVKCPRAISDINEFLMDEYDIIGGYDLGQDYPNLTHHMLLCCTETNTREEIDALSEALAAAAAELT